MSGSKIVDDSPDPWCPTCGDQPVLSEETEDGTIEHRCANGHEWVVATDGGETVETHLWVCVDADGHPVRAYYERETAIEAVESVSYSDGDCADVEPDVTLMEGDDA